MTDTHDRRKADHIRICMEEDVQGCGISTGLERYRLVHCALPAMALKDVELGTTFVGKPLRAPLLLSAMTGGTDRAQTINRHLALAAQQYGAAMCVGSQRAALEDPQWSHTYQVRDVAPDVLLLANLGAVQLNYGYGVDQCRRAVDMIQADGLVLHLNALQECFQADGDTRFEGLLPKIEQVCKALSVPVITKEVGWGLSDRVARQLADAGVAALDVAGAGGTSWSQVEKYRADDWRNRAIAELFSAWGIPTATAIRLVRQALPHMPLIASGGIQTGIQAAVAIALGADLVGVARTLLEAATESAQATVDSLGMLIDTLRIAMFASGQRTVSDLQHAPLLGAHDPVP